jgi:hypothetical protein
VTISVYDIGSSSGSSGGSGTSGGSTGKTYTTEELKKVTWADGKPEEIIAVIQAIDAGTLQVDDLTGWDVGDERTVTLPAMEAGVVDESHEEQDIVVVIMDKTDAAATKTLESDSSNHASFIIGLKNCLNETGVMHTGDSSYTWGTTARRQWCNDTFYKAMLSAFGAKKSDNFFKKVANVTGVYSKPTTLDTVYDYFALPSVVEVEGASTSANVTSAELNSSSLAQFTWYQQGNYSKTINGEVTDATTSKALAWWERSPDRVSSGRFLCLMNSVTQSYGTPQSTQGIAPFGCL